MMAGFPHSSGIRRRRAGGGWKYYIITAVLMRPAAALLSPSFLSFKYKSTWKTMRSPPSTETLIAHFVFLTTEEKLWSILFFFFLSGNRRSWSRSRISAVRSLSKQRGPFFFCFSSASLSFITIDYVIVHQSCFSFFLSRPLLWFYKT